MSTQISMPDAVVTGVGGNIVSTRSRSGSIMKNEVAYICVGDDRLKAEVLRVYGNTADLQVFEETQGVRVGDRVELSGQMLSASLGPGLLGSGRPHPSRPLSIFSGPSRRREPHRKHAPAKTPGRC